MTNADTPYCRLCGATDHHTHHRQFSDGAPLLVEFNPDQQRTLEDWQAMRVTHGDESKVN